MVLFKQELGLLMVLFKQESGLLMVLFKHVSLYMSIKVHINVKMKYKQSVLVGVKVRVMVFNTTCNNISVISWWSVLLVQEIGIPGENHKSH
jgi:hypothetical protein